MSSMIPHFLAFWQKLIFTFSYFMVSFKKMINTCGNIFGMNVFQLHS